MAVWACVVLWVASLSLAAGVRQNVAQGKPAWMSTTREPSQSAANAVDGVTTAVNDTYTIKTKVNEPTAWWKVDLLTPVQRVLVTIYFRTDYKRRRNGVKIYTSMTNSTEPTEGHRCGTVSGRPDGTDINDVLTVTCVEPLHYLTVYTENDNDGAGPVLDFAEVQVWACATGYYGANCTKSCAARHCKISSVCDVIQGECIGGCVTGYWDPDCSEACTRGGRYGDRCRMYCNGRNCINRFGYCPPDTGACSSAGCHARWTGPDCTTCVSGYYGDFCDSCAARHCKMNSSCDGEQGQCIGGCSVGYHGADCTQKCKSGFTYGENCSKNCISRHCLIKGEFCSPDTGACSRAGCQTGWTGADCTACASAYYGINCQSCAARHCKFSSVCDITSGQCVGGCTAGYQGTDCTQFCAPGMYGEGCSKTCRSRHCKTPCHHVTGKCLDGCINGYTGDDCSQPCNSGNYGANCSQSCDARHCKMESSCDVTLGQCVGGCAAGYQGTDCTQVCTSDRYGDNCSKHCNSRHCVDNLYSCPHDTGVCSSAGCLAGWAGTDCTACPSGRYGEGCSKSCSSRYCNTSSTTCDHVTGNCPDGCITGYTGDDCLQQLKTCQRGQFGEGCLLRCVDRHCKSDSSCPVDGACSGGCQEGWTLGNCTQELPRDSAITPTTAGIIGLVAGVCLILILALGLLVGLVRQGRLQWMNSAQKNEAKVRATSTQSNRDSAQPSDNYTSVSEQASGCNISNSDYDRLDVETKAKNDYTVIQNKVYENM